MTESEHPAPWTFPEYAPVGVVLGTPEAVSRYDERQGTTRADDNALLDRLGVGDGTRLLDLACGTGSFVVEAARRGARARGVDVSKEMLSFAAAGARSEGVDAEFSHGGFLDFPHDAEPADVVTTKSALHQLPDMWKQLALRRAAAALRPGGTFYLWDVAFSFDPADTTVEIERWIERLGGTGFSREDFETHVREEFSTWTWILEGLLDRAGLDVVELATPSPTYAEFRCRKR